jgi:hypothetical protein
VHTVRKKHFGHKPEVKILYINDTKSRASGGEIYAKAHYKMLWAGRIISGLLALFLLIDGVMKLLKPAPVVEATVQLGYSESVLFSLGIVLIACTLLYVMPRTSVLGAILLTGYMGGAVTTHVRVGESLFSIFFSVMLGVLI